MPIARLIRSACLALLPLFLGACSIHHYIAQDFPTYLAHNPAPQALQAAPLHGLSYRLDDATAAHRYSFRGAMAGYAHVWVVEFGKMLCDYLATADLTAAFPGLHKVSAGQTADLVFSLDDYQVREEPQGVAAFLNLGITLLKNGQPMLSKVYNADGESEGARVIALGPFGMKNAVQRSTTVALDNVFKQFNQDLQQLPTER